VSLMRMKTYKDKFAEIPLQKNFARLYGLGNIATSVLGALNVDEEVDGMQTLHRFLIVPDTKINVIIGFDFIKKFTVVLENGKYAFKRGNDTVAENDHNIYNVVSHELELDVRGEYKTVVKQMVDDYKPSDVKLTCPVKMTIIPNCTNIAFREHPSRSSAAKREIIRKQVEECLQLGIVRELCSDVASNVVLAKKKDKTYRLCIDYRILSA